MSGERAHGPFEELLGNGPGQRKYRLLHDALAALIRELPAGSGMPTERELCERFGVSRGTVRQALDHLEAEQRILRHQGRGTFVAGPKMDHLLELTSHTAYFRARGMQPGSRLVGVTRAPAGSEVAGMLALAEGRKPSRSNVCAGGRRGPGRRSTAPRGQALRRGRCRARRVAVAVRAAAGRYGVELAWAEETIEAALAPETRGSPPRDHRRRARCSCCAGRASTPSGGRSSSCGRSIGPTGSGSVAACSLRPPPLAALLPGDTRLRLASVSDAPGLARVFVSAWREGYVGIVDQSVLDALDEADIADWLADVDIIQRADDVGGGIC